MLVVVGLAVAAAVGVVTGPTTPGHPSDVEAVSTVWSSWGPCLDALGVTVKDATVERLAASTGVGGRAVRVTVSDGGMWVVRGDDVVPVGDVAVRDAAACRAPSTVPTGA